MEDTEKELTQVVVLILSQARHGLTLSAACRSFGAFLISSANDFVMR